MRVETHCRHMGYSFRLAAIVPLYAPSHRQDSTYHSLCYTSRGAMAGTRNSSMGPPHEGLIHRTMRECSYHGATSRSSQIDSVSITCSSLPNQTSHRSYLDETGRTDHGTSLLTGRTLRADRLPGFSYSLDTGSLKHNCCKNKNKNSLSLHKTVGYR